MCSVGHRHKTDIRIYIQIFHFFKLLPVSTCAYQCRCLVFVSVSMLHRSKDYLKSLFYVCELKYEHASNDGINDKTVIQNAALESY